MATPGRSSTEDARRAAISPRPKGRENAKDTLCKNVTIYGHCRYENKGCAFNHDPNRNQTAADSMKKRLNVDSPSFRPSNMAGPILGANGAGPKSFGLSPKAANAAPFEPGKGYVQATPSDLATGYAKKPQYNPAAPDWSSLAPSTDIPDFLPQSHLTPANLGDPNDGFQQGLYDPYANSTNTMNSAAHGNQQGQINPYAQDTTANGNGTYFQPNTFAQPLQYHLYTPMGPHREDLLPYQRTVHDFFIPQDLREELQRKSAATLQTLPNSTLPQIEHYHSLVPLDTSNQKNASIFGYPSWIYKAVSGKNGNTYAVRRLEGYRLTNERAIHAIRKWKGISNGNIVSTIEAFTNRSFGDSSLFIVTDYHPLSKTLAEAHFPFRYNSGPNGAMSNHRTPGTPPPEPVLWSYMLQIGQALFAIHGAGLAARVLDPSKVLLTGQNRVRLGACGVLDIVQHENANRSLLDLQRDDLGQFGRLLLAVGTGNAGAFAAPGGVPKALEILARSYSPALQERVRWLLNAGAAQPGGPGSGSIEPFMNALTPRLLADLDATNHLTDRLMAELNRSLENGRVARLMIKLMFVTERPDYGHDRQWAETGERFTVKLFRDYVFHQVDANGAPVLDVGHVLACLNKLDAGSEERVVLTSRDEQACVVVSFREMKRMVDNAIGDLMKAGRRPPGGM